MELWTSAHIRLAELVVSCAALASVEAVFPLFRFKSGRLRRALPNLVLTLGVVLANLLFASVSVALSMFLTNNRIGLLLGMHNHPWILLLFNVAGLDLFAYFAHRLLHKTAWGWKFHRVHHSELEVDVTTAFRQHPVETLWRFSWQCLAIAVLGLPFWTLSIYLSLSGLNALLEHANVRINDGLDNVVRWLIVTPNMHKIHHSRQVAETDSNYSNIFSIWDRLLSTYRWRTDYRRIQYGLDGFDEKRRQTLTALLAEPFRAS
jgi:sterol desaturase/sphingolipid hydroxylase (fatty acid hydroxylase superfamily)